MEKSFTVPTANVSDLIIQQVGTEVCKPCHSYGPAIRNSYVLHYILKGKGYFEENGNIHHLEKGQAFLICPDIVTYYAADNENPWTYMWLHFQGIKSKEYLERCGLNKSNVIFTAKNKLLIEKHVHDILEYCFNNAETPSSVMLTGMLYMIFSSMITDAAIVYKPNAVQDYIDPAIGYINSNYHKKITVTELADYVGINRSYLCSIFNKYIEMSPQDFILNFKMDRACELLLSKNVTIGDVARSVGYDDQLAFSKMFKKNKGLSPLNWVRESAVK